ncbi:MAG: phenylalanine--tRNA ligase subunit beta, partial [Bacteroidales bacterium]|nr:phenylalanine--tRNA ligase subunit beta [Bacteroidales bacterium]
MKISYKWLKDLLTFDLSAEETSVYLTDCGLEVEGIDTFETVKGGLKGLVIGEVLTCEAHPNSDHLHVTTVEVGREEPLHIVCGAPNVAAGQKVVVATIGTTLYQGDESFTIKKSKLRGEPSEGMICAEDEIGLGQSHDGIMVLDPSAVPGTPAAEYFHLESDTIFEIGLTPNRCDAISHVGVARDLHAVLAQNGIECSPLIHPSAPELKPIANVKFRIDIDLQNKKDCPRYTGLLFDNVKVSDSPEWLQTKLKSVGIRPINNIVDIGNYVMLLRGNPVHVYDYDKLKKKELIIKDGLTSKCIALDEKTYDITPEDIIITSNDDIACIAGVM